MESFQQNLEKIINVLFLFGFLYFLWFLWLMIFSKKPKHSQHHEPQWFGKDPPPLMSDTVTDSSEDTSIRPFKISVSNEVLEDLKLRLDRTRYEDPVQDSKFLYGFNPNYLRKVVDYWRKEYDWRAQEEMLNRLPQFKTRIEGIDVHFLHIKPKLPEGSSLKVLPLMVIHGWPGSIVEFCKIIPMLTTPRPGHNFVFEVICPSIPGFGFSESPHRKGFTVTAAARVFLTLMERVGHRKFYVQGGDWGSMISKMMAKCYPSRIIGVHLNMYPGRLQLWEAMKLLVINFFPFLISKAEYRMFFPISRAFKTLLSESGYFHLQSTKPDTLGCGMADSPAGMAAYLLEKFGFWSNPEYLELEDGGLTEKFTLDELLTNVMLYWINNNFTAAARTYKENISLINQEKEKMPVVVPSAIAVFPHEVLMLPKTCIAQQMKNMVSYTIMPRGGHFAALEEPQLLADDVWKFVSVVEKRM